MNSSRISIYAKAVGAGLVSLAGFAAVVVAALSDGAISPSEWVQILSAFGVLVGGTYTVYKVPNTPDYR
jgi:hypothetical protein